MEVLAHVVILGLAAWRITNLVLNERGPYAILARFRTTFGVVHNEDGEPASWPDTETGRLLRCLWCGSIWAGLCLAGLYMWNRDAAVVFSIPFAVSAVAILTDRVREG